MLIEIKLCFVNRILGEIKNWKFFMIIFKVYYEVLIDSKLMYLNNVDSGFEICYLVI